MKLQDLHEASIHEERYLRNTVWKSPQEIERWLTTNGFKLLGQGAYSAAFHKPGAKRIVKISMAEDRCWNEFVNWAITQTNNPHLPNINWVKEYQGTRKGKSQTFIVSIVEVLAPLTPMAIEQTKDLAGLAELYLSGSMQIKNANAIKRRFARKGIRSKKALRKWLDDNHLTLFSKTLNRFDSIADRSNCFFDFHDGNIMYRPSTGNLVLIDPLADLANITVYD